MRIKNFSVDTEEGDHFSEKGNWLCTNSNFIYIYYENGQIWNRSYWNLDKCLLNKIEFNNDIKLIIIEHLTISFRFEDDYEFVKNNLNNII